MNLEKHYEYFNPTKVEAPIHIVGCGAIGSTIATSLARLGISNIHLYDFDTVDPHNIANQTFNSTDIGKPKVAALKNALELINPDIELKIHEKGYTENNIRGGYVFLCVDNIDLRKRIVEESKLSPYVHAFFDFRMGLSDAQHYAQQNTDTGIERLLKTMDFDHTEAKANMPVSACGTNLNILPTVQMIVALGIANFINYIKTEQMKNVILIDAFKPSLLEF